MGTAKQWYISTILVLAVILAAAWRFLPSLHSSGNSLIQEASAAEILQHVRDLHSPVVLLNFWASWCGPCKEEFPSLLKLKRDFETQGLKVVFVSVDNPSDLDKAIAFLQANQVTFPTFYKGSQSLNFVTEIWPQWSGAVPASVLMGPDLKILDAWEGGTSLEEFQTRVKKQLKGS